MSSKVVRVVSVYAGNEKVVDHTIDRKLSGMIQDAESFDGELVNEIVQMLFLTYRSESGTNADAVENDKLLAAIRVVVGLYRGEMAAEMR